MAIEVTAKLKNCEIDCPPIATDAMGEELLINPQVPLYIWLANSWAIFTTRFCGLTCHLTELFL